MILCPYHGPRRPSATNESLCSACAGPAESIPPLTPFIPLAPLIAQPTYPAAAAEFSAAAFSTAPAQWLLTTAPTPLVTSNDLLPQIPQQIAGLERALAGSAIAPIGPLILLYDHPDLSDFEHFHFAAAYPVNPASPLPPNLHHRPLPSHPVASIQCTGPWSMLHLAYPALRRAIVSANRSFGPLTLERYVRPFGTNDPRNIVIVQRELAPA